MTATTPPLILTTPDFPKAVAPVSLDLIPTYHGLLNEFTGRRPTKDAASLETNRELLRKISACRRAIDESRTIAKDPFYKHAQAVDSFAKPFLSTLDAQVHTLKGEIATYAAAVEAARMKQEEERARLEKQAADAANDGRTAPLITTMGLPIERADVPTRDDVEFDSFDVTRIPHKYLIPDIPAIKADILAGVNVPGVVFRKVKKVIAR